jgi:hypothetical protein
METPVQISRTQTRLSREAALCRGAASAQDRQCWRSSKRRLPAVAADGQTDGVPVLIFEGADLVGKTTLARQFSLSLGYPIVKLRWDLKDAEAETVAYAKATLGLLAATRADVILDRSYLSMWAYAKDPSYMQPLIAALDELSDACLVVLTADAPVLRERYRRTPDLSFSEADVLDANERFTRILDVVPPAVGTIHLNTARTSVADCYRAVDRLLAVTTGTPLEVCDQDFETTTIKIGVIPVEVAYPRRPDHCG